MKTQFRVAARGVGKERGLVVFEDSRDAEVEEQAPAASLQVVPNFHVSAPLACACRYAVLRADRVSGCGTGGRALPPSNRAPWLPLSELCRCWGKFKPSVVETNVVHNAGSKASLTDVGLMVPSHERGFPGLGVVGFVLQTFHVNCSRSKISPRRFLGERYFYCSVWSFPFKPLDLLLRNLTSRSD